MQGHARCTHVQVASATLGYITRTVATQLATNTIIIFLLLNGCLLLLSTHRLRHMRPPEAIPAAQSMAQGGKSAHFLLAFTLTLQIDAPHENRPWDLKTASNGGHAHPHVRHL